MDSAWMLQEICPRVRGELHGEGQVRIRSLAIDSRKLIPSGDTLFIALSGEHHDGHHYIGELFDLGGLPLQHLEQLHLAAPCRGALRAAGLGGHAEKCCPKYGCAAPGRGGGGTGVGPALRAAAAGAKWRYIKPPGPPDKRRCQPGGEVT